MFTLFEFKMYNGEIILLNPNKIIEIVPSGDEIMVRLEENICRILKISLEDFKNIFQQIGTHNFDTNL